MLFKYINSDVEICQYSCLLCEIVEVFVYKMAKVVNL
jgi:hypothetical protein